MQLAESVTAGVNVELLERSDDPSALDARLDAMSENSRGQLVLVRGEAGIGKTALLDRFCEGVARDVRVLRAACDPLFTPRPLGPLLDVARETGGELSERVNEGALPHDVALALINELAAPAPAPTVLVLEDVHWADEATLDVLRLLARRVDTVPVLLVTTYRQEQLHRTHPLQVVLGELPAGRRVTRLELRPLSRAAVAALCAESPLDADDLFERTAGNPFFVTEVLAAQTERLPSTVRDAVLARAARLSPAARSVLDAVAIVPQRTELWLLEALAGGPADGLDECLGSGMLSAHAAAVAFRHELARLAIAESLAPDRAATLHRRALAGLTDPPIGAPELARLAHHAEAAGDADAVLRIAPEAAEEAASLGAHREAVAQYGRALRFAGGIDPAARAELLARFADECYFTDMRHEGLAALDDALSIHAALGDALKHGETQQLRGRMLLCVGEVSEAMAAAQDALVTLEPLAPGRELARAYSALADISLHVDDSRGAMKWGRLAADLGERVGDAQALVLGLNCLGTAQLARGVAEGRDALRRCMEVAKQAGLAPEVGRAYINLIDALGRRHEHAHAGVIIEEGITWCREHGLEVWLQYILAGQAEWHLVQGRWDEAADAALTVLNAPPSSVVSPRIWAEWALARVRARRGDPGYWPLLDEAREAAGAIGELQHIAPVAMVRAEAAWARGAPRRGCGRDGRCLRARPRATSGGATRRARMLALARRAPEGAAGWRRGRLPLDDHRSLR